MSLDSQESGAAEESFLSHLVELRDRLIRALLAVLVVFVCLFPWSRELYSLLANPLLATLPAAAPHAIALLRLDTDWEASTRHELESLWPRLVPGGIIIIDDYGYWQGARAATDDFWASLGHNAPMLHRIDATGRIAVKI